MRLPTTPRGELRHGTLTGYAYHRCRCEPCLQAGRVYRQGRSDNREREYNRAYYLATKPRRQAKERLRRYGITAERYEELLATQGGRCAICGDCPSPERALGVDHDHDTGEVRGLLCIRCNRAVGCLRDDPDLAVAAAEYLRRQ